MLSFFYSSFNYNFHLQFFDKKGVPDVKSAEDLFKSITGFAEVDINMLEGVHTIYNSLSSRFEIAPDDNRNVKYPFEYVWQKTSENKKGNSDSSAEEDEFDEMWTHSKQKEIVDVAADFGNELKIDNTAIDKEVNFGNVIAVAVTTPTADVIKNDADISSIEIDKKS